MITPPTSSCKDFERYKLKVIDKCVGRKPILSFISVNITDVFAFENKERNGNIRLNAKKRGWDRFDWAVEFARQGIGTVDDRKWKITDFNMGYKVLIIIIHIFSDHLI